MIVIVVIFDVAPSCKNIRHQIPDTRYQKPKKCKPAWKFQGQLAFTKSEGSFFTALRPFASLLWAGIAKWTNCKTTNYWSQPLLALCWKTLWNNFIVDPPEEVPVQQAKLTNAFLLKHHFWQTPGPFNLWSQKIVSSTISAQTLWKCPLVLFSFLAKILS